MHSQELLFMAEFIQEVMDFKSFICAYQSSGVATFIGLNTIFVILGDIEDFGK